MLPNCAGNPDAQGRLNRPSVRDRIVHLEVRQIVRNVRVVAHLPFADEHRDQRRRERLRAGADLEQRFVIDRRFVRPRQRAVTFGV